MFSKIMFIAITTVSFLAFKAQAAGLTVKQIVDKANAAAYYEGNDGLANVHMTITDAQGRTRVRAFTILRKNIQAGGEQKFYVYFYKPEDIRGMVYMVWKHLGKDDDRWQIGRAHV